MADSQDSAGIPLSSGARTAKAILGHHFTEPQSAILIRLIRSAVKQESIAISVEVGERFGAIQSQLRELDAKFVDSLKVDGLAPDDGPTNQELKQEIENLRTYAHKLQALFSQTEQWRVDAAKDRTDAKADKEVLQKTIQRVDGLVKVATLARKGLESIIRFAGVGISLCNDIIGEPYNNPRRRRSDFKGR